MSHSGARKQRPWWTLALALLLACASGPPRAPEPLALRTGAYAQPGGAGGSGPSAPGLKVPLTMARLVQLATAKGIGTAGAAVTRNREIGLAFQTTVLRSLDIEENTEKFPAPGRGGPYTSVIPDSVLLAGRINLAGRLTFNPRGALLEVFGAECLEFLEVKARSCRITLSSARRQLRGFIDALAAQRPRRAPLLGPQPPRPALLLVTTADTEVAEEVSLEAGQRGVAVFQAMVWEETGLLTVGSFVQRTGFADVPRQFPLPSRAEALIP
jgi:hypothetical protein